MKRCPSCGADLPAICRYCTQCGRRLQEDSSPLPGPGIHSPLGELDIRILYAMVVALLLALLFPPWESAPARPAEFLGFHFILTPPEPDAMVSRMLLTIELTTIAIGGFYFSWLFRERTGK
jgi:hypothetical protein